MSGRLCYAHAFFYKEAQDNGSEWVVYPVRATVTVAVDSIHVDQLGLVKQRRVRIIAETSHEESVITHAKKKIERGC